jgi:hypothetical protein
MDLLPMNNENFENVSYLYSSSDKKLMRNLE